MTTGESIAGCTSGTAPAWPRRAIDRDCYRVPLRLGVMSLVETAGVAFDPSVTRPDGTMACVAVTNALL